MVSKDSVICPYCKKQHSKNKALGTSGLINYNGGERSINCNKCGNTFRCEYEVQIKYRTSKE